MINTIDIVRTLCKQVCPVERFLVQFCTPGYNEHLCILPIKGLLHFASHGTVTYKQQRKPSDDKLNSSDSTLNSRYSKQNVLDSNLNSRYTNRNSHTSVTAPKLFVVLRTLQAHSVSAPQPPPPPRRALQSRHLQFHLPPDLASHRLLAYV